MNGNLAMKEEKIYYAPEEYQEMVKQSERRLEYYEGEIVSLASASYRHQSAAANLYLIIGYHFKNKKCRAIYELDCNLFEDDSVIVIPDMVVVCDPNKFGENQVKGVPDLVVEILSPSTFRNDLLKKYHYYRSAGVKEYWIVDPMNEVLTIITWDDNQEVRMDYSETNGHPLVVSALFPDLKVDVREIF